MLPKLELHRGSSMEFSSGTMAGFRKRWKKDLRKKVEKHEEEENTQEQVRMPMTMDGNEDTQTRLEPHVTYEHISAMHLKTVRSVLRTTQCSRQCAL